MRDFAADLQSWNDSGRSSVGRRWIGDHVYGSDLRKHALTPPAEGVRKAVRIDARPGAPMYVVRDRGSDILCGEVVEQDIAYPRPGAVLVQGRDRRNYGVWVPPGRYESIESPARLLTCLRTADGG